ncbi:MAG: peptide chain release factor N(5)-glutamine methyltransferase [Brevibacterium sp.]
MVTQPDQPTAVLLRDAAAELERGGVPSPQADARQLLAHVLDLEPARLLLVDEVPPDRASEFTALVSRRAGREPLQHLTGRAWFRHTSVEVGPGVFVPRPETEAMTGWAIDRLAGMVSAHPAPSVVELCTGSGVIAKSVAEEVPTARVHAIELEESALAYAERNLSGTGVDLRAGDMAGSFADLDGLVDLVIANPPYIPLEAYESVAPEARDHDPSPALFSGADGLDALRVVASVAARLLRPGGLVCAEHAEVQAESAPRVFLEAGSFERIRDELDLTGRPRFVTAVRG